MGRSRIYKTDEEKKLAARKDWRDYYSTHHKELADKRAIYNRTLRGKYKMLRNDYRDFEMTLTFEVFEILNSLPCHYCGGKLPEAGYGLDRVNPALGYVIGNVVPCCTDCNVAKHDRTEEEFREWALRLCNHWASK